jgi:hypothetical protein
MALTPFERALEYHLTRMQSIHRVNIPYTKVSRWRRLA